MEGTREKRNLQSAVPSQHPGRITTDQDECDEAQPTVGSKIMELERIIAEQNKKICYLEGYLMRKHTEEGRVHTSSQTEAAPVFSITPAPPKEGAPRKNVRHHRRHKTFPPVQAGMPCESCDKKVSSRDVGIQASNLKEDVSILISFSRRKASQGLHRSAQSLPPIQLAKETSPFHQLHAGTVSVDMTPPCKPEINCVTL